MRIADEEGSDPILNTEVDHFAGSLVPYIPNAPLGTATQLILRVLKFLPAPRVLFATGLLLSNLAKLLCPLPLE